MSNTRSLFDSFSFDQTLGRVVVALILACLLIALLRTSMVDDSRLSGGDSTWQVTFSGQVELNEPGEIQITPLQNTAHVRVYGLHIYHPGLRQKPNINKSRPRDIVLSASEPGLKSFSVSFDVHLSQLPHLVKNTDSGQEMRDQWLKASEGVFIDAAGTAEILAELLHQQPEPDEVARFLFDHVSERVTVLNEGAEDATMVMELRTGSRLGITRALISLLRSAHLPTRLVTGIDLTAGSAQQPYFWLEVFYQGTWHTIDVVRGHFDHLPRESVPVKRGARGIARLNKDQPIPLNIQSSPHPSPANAGFDNDSNPLQIFDLMRIAPDGREALALLILLPIGVLVTELLRQFVGLRTFGTFTPSLLALAWVFADLKTAMVVFSLVVLFGVAGRALLPRLKLTRAMRLSIVFTMVAGIMVFAVSALLFFDSNIDAQVVLLPIVVLTTLVDRFYSVADEVDIMTAVKRLLWTLAVAVVSMLILLQGMLGQWLLQYPEAHLLTVALIILSGAYRGKRLAELPSFRWIAETTPLAGKKKTQTESED